MVVTLLATVPVAAQTQADVALSFFRAGGAYCFRVAPLGVALSEETNGPSCCSPVPRTTKTRSRLASSILARPGCEDNSIWSCVGQPRDGTSCIHRAEHKEERVAGTWIGSRAAFCRVTGMGSPHESDPS